MSMAIYQCHPFRAVRAESFDAAARIFAQRAATGRLGGKGRVLDLRADYTNDTCTVCHYVGAITRGRGRGMADSDGDTITLAIYRWIPPRLTNSRS